MIPDFKTPSGDLFPIMILAGLGAGFGHLLIVLATRLIPAARAAPTQYSQIVWATVMGAAFFGEYPDWIAVLGMIMVAGAGLFTFAREEKTARWPSRTPLLRNR